MDLAWIYQWAYGFSFFGFSSLWRVFFSAERHHNMATVIPKLWPRNHLHWIPLGGFGFTLELLNENSGAQARNLHWTSSQEIHVANKVWESPVRWKEHRFVNSTTRVRIFTRPGNSPNLLKPHFLICKARWAAIVFQDWGEAQAITSCDVLCPH